MLSNHINYYGQSHYQSNVRKYDEKKDRKYASLKTSLQLRSHFMQKYCNTFQRLLQSSVQLDASFLT
ncbi:hypothetical protein RB195_023898 [Necator americanus]|uniref:Uncharacterized protein n=1 Tax=Necator americanus TaxID=51031 RepID=A0ABR1EL14_NECAM